MNNTEKRKNALINYLNSLDEENLWAALYDIQNGVSVWAWEHEEEKTFVDIGLTIEKLLQ